jgi:ketosteroid isomerase-like protein
MAGDVDALMEDYTEDSVIFIPEGPVRGLEAIKGLMTSLVTEMVPPGSDFNLINQSIEGEVGLAWVREGSRSFRFFWVLRVLGDVIGLVPVR